MVTTLNPSDEHQITLSNGNLTATYNGGEGLVRSTTSKSSGKYHIEFTDVLGATGGNISVGFADATYPISSSPYLGEDVHALGFWNDSPSDIYYNNAVLFTSGAGTFVTGDTIALEIDFTAQLIWLRNITSGPAEWNGSATANPATGTGGASFSAMSTGTAYFIAVNCLAASSSITANFGSAGFALTPSAGFTGWDPSAIVIFPPNITSFLGLYWT